MKEQLVAQLKTQITDLERFIQFLQDPAGNKCNCCPEIKKKTHPTANVNSRTNTASKRRPLNLERDDEVSLKSLKPL